MVDLIHANGRLQRKMSTTSSNLDHMATYAHKATKHYMLVYFKHLSAPVVVVIDTRYSTVAAVISPFCRKAHIVT